MNATSRAILQTLLSSDDSLTAPKKQAIKRLMDGSVEAPPVAQGATETMLLTQKQATKYLSYDVLAAINHGDEIFQVVTAIKIVVSSISECDILVAGKATGEISGRRVWATSVQLAVARASGNKAVFKPSCAP